MEIPTELALELMLAADFLNGTNVQSELRLICANSTQSDVRIRGISGHGDVGCQMPKVASARSRYSLMVQVHG